MNFVAGIKDVAKRSQGEDHRKNAAKNTAPGRPPALVKRRARIVLAAALPAARPVPLPSLLLLLRLPSLSPPSPGPSFPRHRAVYKSPSPAYPPTAGDPGTLAPGAGTRRLRIAGTLRSRRFNTQPFHPGSSLFFPAGLPRTGLFPSLPGMSEKRVEEVPAELSAKEMKEKKEKIEEKTVHKEKKKEVVEDEENGAEEDEEENPDDVDEEEGGDEDEEGDENGQEQDGHAEKRSAEEEEDEVDPKRQKTENGSSA
ncbi:parathymosin [Accipiter gentilis]|uniref:parathymosin n=2 Tax=Accipitrinae TaxID=8955 RepID=UPI00211044FB|nr:parathymosin [Accipiter gentilis]